MATKIVLSKEKFIEILAKYKGEKSFAEIAEIINKNYTTADGRLFTASIIADRARDAGLKGYSKIDTKPLTIKQIKNLSSKANIKLYNKGDISLDTFRDRAISKASDARRGPEVKARRAKAEKIRYHADMATEEGRARIKANRVRAKALEYAKQGIDPPATTATEALWKDIVYTAKKNIGQGRFTLKGHKKSMNRADFFSDKIKITDSVTGETFTFGENIESKGNKLKNFINKNAKSFGIANFQEAVKPHQQKYWINDQRNLRNSINKQLIPGWTEKSKRNAFEVHHSSGRQTNPLKTSLTFWDANQQEWRPREAFNKAWAENIKASDTGKIKVTPEIKEALKTYKTKIGELGVMSQPEAATRATRAPIGTSFLLDEILRGAKTRGAVLPKGVLSKAAGFEKVLLDYAKTNKGNVCQLFLNKGGRVGFAAGSNCVTKMTAALEANPIRTTEQVMELPGNYAINKAKNIAKGFLGALGRFGPAAGKYGAIAAAGAIAQPLVKQFMNDDPSTYLTDEHQQAGMLDALIEGERPKPRSEALDLAHTAGTVGATAAAVPGTGALYKYRRGLSEAKIPKAGPITEAGLTARDYLSKHKQKLLGGEGRGAAPQYGKIRAGAGVGMKLLSGMFTPAGLLATEPLRIAQQRREGESWGEIATDPYTWMGPAFAPSMTRMATAGMKKGSLLPRLLRLGISRGALAAMGPVGWAGLAASLGWEGRKQYSDYKKGRGFFARDEE